MGICRGVAISQCARFERKCRAVNSDAAGPSRGGGQPRFFIGRKAGSVGFGVFSKRVRSIPLEKEGRYIIG